MILRALLACTLLTGTAPAQLSVPGAPAASTESQTDQHRRYLIGTWVQAVELVDENQIRQFISITWTFRADGSGTMTVRMEMGKVDGSGKQIREQGKPGPITYRIDSTNPQSFTLTRWGSDKRIYREDLTVVDADTMQFTANGIDLKRQP